MADIKNYGLAGIGANVQLGKNGGYIDYTGDAFSLTTFGGGDAVLNLGNVTVSNTFSDGTLTIASGDLSTTGDLTAEVVNFGSLNDGSISITNFDNDGTLAANSATVVATQQAVKSYIDNNVTAQDLDFQGDEGGALAVDLDSQTFIIAGGTNISTSGADQTLTVNLDDTISLAGDLSAVNGEFTGNLDITGDLSVGGVLLSGGVGGSISGAESVSANSIVANNDLTVSGFLVDGIIDDDSMASASATTLATSESIKQYVDDQVSSSASDATLAVDSDSGSGDVNLSTGTFTINGTANEVETAFVDGTDTLTIGLPNNVTIGNNLTVTNDASVGGGLTVTGNAVITGDLTVNGTQTIVNTETVSIADAIIRVNSDGVAAPAGFEANLNGTIESILYDPTATLSPDSNDNGAWVFSDDVIATTTLSAGNLQTTGTATVGTLTDGTATLTGGDFSGLGTVTAGTVTDGTLSITGGDLSTTGDLTADVVNFGSLNDGSISIESFDNDPLLAANSATVVATQQAVKAYVDAKATAATLTFTDDSSTAGLTIDLDSETFSVLGGTNITTVGLGNDLTVNLDDDVTLAGNLSAVDGTFSGTVEGGTVTDGTLSITGGELTGAGNITAAGTVEGATLTDGTLSISGGAITGATGNIVTTGTVEGATVTDGTATLTGGDFTSATGTVTAGSVTDGTATLTGGNLTTTGDVSAADVTATGTVQFGTLSDGTDSITSFVTEADGITSNDNDDSVPTTAAVIDYVSGQLGAEVKLNVTGDGNTVGNIVLATETLSIVGTANEVETAFDGTDTITIGLPDDVTIGQDLTVTRDLFADRNVEIAGNLTVTGSTTTIDVTQLEVTDPIIHLASNNTSNVFDIGFVGHYSNDGGVTSNHTGIVRDATDQKYKFFNTLIQAGLDDGDTTVDFANSTLSVVVADTFEGDVSGAEGVFTGNVEFGTLTDGTTSIASFVTEADTIVGNDNDTTVPTTAAVIDYVTTNSAAAPDGLLVRGSFTANSSDNAFDVATMPNISGRTYYADRVVINVGTGFSGGSFDHIKVYENGGAGTVLVAEADADAAVAGTYVVHLDGTVGLTAGQPVSVEFLQSDGVTGSIPTAGQVTVAVHYNWV